MSFGDKLLMTVAPSIPPYLAAGIPRLDLTPEGIAASVNRSPTPPSGRRPAAAGHDLRIATLALALGGHLGAGFADNLYYRPGELVLSNAQLIECLVRLAREIGREVASSGEARLLLGLRPRSGSELAAAAG